MVDHRGLVLLPACVHLHLGYGYVVSGNTANTKVAYQNFLTLRKDADPGIPT